MSASSLCPLLCNSALCILFFFSQLSKFKGVHTTCCLHDSPCLCGRVCPVYLHCQNKQRGTVLDTCVLVHNMLKARGIKRLHASLRNTLGHLCKMPLCCTGRLCKRSNIRRRGILQPLSLCLSTHVSLSPQEFEVLSQIRVLQASCAQYNLPHHPRIAAWLRGHKLLTDQER